MKVTALREYPQSYIGISRIHDIGDAAKAIESIPCGQLQVMHVLLDDGTTISGLEAVKMVITSLCTTVHRAENRGEIA